MKSMPQVLTTTEGLARLLDPLAEYFSPAVARKVGELQADPAVQTRIDKLATGANQGRLREAELAE